MLLVGVEDDTWLASIGNVEKISLKFTFKNINRVASLNVIRQIIPIYSSRVFETTRRWNSSTDSRCWEDERRLRLGLWVVKRSRKYTGLLCCRTLNVVIWYVCVCRLGRFWNESLTTCLHLARTAISLRWVLSLSHHSTVTYLCAYSVLILGRMSVLAAKTTQSAIKELWIKTDKPEKSAVVSFMVQQKRL